MVLESMSFVVYGTRQGRGTGMVPKYIGEMVESRLRPGRVVRKR
jgi:hypothetical protein